MTPEVEDLLMEVASYLELVKRHYAFPQWVTEELLKKIAKVMAHDESDCLDISVKNWESILVPWLKAHANEIEVAIQQKVPLDMVLKSTHTLSNEGC